MKRRFIVLFLAVLMRGHGFTVPVTTETVVFFDHDAPAPILPAIPASTHLWLALWGDGRGEVRSELTEPASPRLQSVYGVIVRRARARQFKFRPPALYQTKDIVQLLLPLPPIRVYGRHFVGPNRILVTKEWTDRMTDTELQVLLAHELGHAIDDQTERIGHRSFKSVYWFGQQEFADHIAELLVGIEAVAVFDRRYILADANP